MRVALHERPVDARRDRPRSRSRRRTGATASVDAQARHLARGGVAGAAAAAQAGRSTAAIAPRARARRSRAAGLRTRRRPSGRHRCRSGGQSGRRLGIDAPAGCAARPLGVGQELVIGQALRGRARRGAAALAASAREGRGSCPAVPGLAVDRPRVARARRGRGSAAARSRTHRRRRRMPPISVPRRSPSASRMRPPPLSRQLVQRQTPIDAAGRVEAQVGVVGGDAVELAVPGAGRVADVLERRDRQVPVGRPGSPPGSGSISCGS